VRRKKNKTESREEERERQERETGGGNIMWVNCIQVFVVRARYLQGNPNPKPRCTIKELVIS